MSIAEAMLMPCWGMFASQAMPMPSWGLVASQAKT
jgi:hypothetical protein